MKIRNINSEFGDPVEFEGIDEAECVSLMEAAIESCGAEFALDDELVEGVDYEII